MNLILYIVVFKYLMLKGRHLRLHLKKLIDVLLHLSQGFVLDTEFTRYFLEHARVPCMNGLKRFIFISLLMAFAEIATMSENKARESGIFF